MIERTETLALDRFMIHEVISLSAGFLYDEGDFDALETLWAHDAVFDVEPKPEFSAMPLRGRDAIIGMYRKRQPEVYGYEPRRHVITNITIDEMDATTARCRSYMTLLSVLAASPLGSLELMGAATYYDELRKDEGRWMLTYRRSVLYGGSFSDRRDSGHHDGKSVEARNQSATSEGEVKDGSTR